MTDLAKEMLQSIANKVNKPSGLQESYDNPVSPSKFKGYHNATLAERRQAHEYFKLLQATENWLKVDFKPRSFGDNELLERMTIHHSRQLLEHLNLDVEYDVAQSAIAKVSHCGLKMPEHLGKISEALENSWGRGKTFFSCHYKSHEKLIQALQVLEYLQQENNQSKSIDYRTLSSRLFQNSKHLESILPLIANLLKPLSPDYIQTQKPNEILAYWGISRFPPSIRLKGPIGLETPKGYIDLRAAWPFIEIPPDGFSRISFDNFDVIPSYVLFIENKTTFERYTREIEDNGLIVYTNGFPPRSWQGIISGLDKSIPLTVPFFHWGDIDLGGFEIFRFMSHLLQRNLEPHLMDSFNPASSDQGVAMAKLKAILHKIESPGAQRLLDQLNKLSPTMTFIDPIEQEILEVLAPSVESLG